MKKTLNEIITLASIAPRHEPLMARSQRSAIWVRRPTAEEIENIHSLTKAEIRASRVPLPVIRAVHKHNKDSFWGVYQAPAQDRKNSQFLGYYAFLHLNQAGRTALERDEFDSTELDLSLLVPSGERPAAIYIWAVVARRLAWVATPLVVRALGTELYGDLPIYAKAGTMGGLNVIKGYGFHGAREAEAGLGHLFRLDPPEPQKTNIEAA